MSIINAYGDPTITVWEIDDNGNKISIPILNETKQVIGNKIVLEGLPDEQYRVFIDGFVEINIKDKITESNQFKVDYRKNGIVFVHESLDGQWITINSYSSRGLVYIPASRIWTKIDDFGNVIETLESIVIKVEYLSEIIDDFENILIDAEESKTQLNNSISSGSALKNNLNNSITEGQLINSDINTTINNANSKNTELSTTITNANTVKSELDDSISVAETTKIGLNDSIDNANLINDVLSNNTNGTIKNASDIDIELKSTINTATTKKSQLDTSISNATDTKQQLDGSINEAKSVQYEIDDMVKDIETVNPFIETFVATEGQQEFILTKGQYKKIEMTTVYIQGVSIDPIIDFILVDDEFKNKIYINEPLPVGTEVKVHVLQTLSIESDSSGLIIP